MNAACVQRELFESELFGHRKGAFSGALDHRDGLVRTADGGTLFLDEIGDLPPTSQAALLRVLQEREVMPVGATKPIPIDLRVVAATHRDLKTLAASGSFRQDLFARLAGFRVTLPLLRDRTDDLGLLIGTFHDRVTSGADHPGFEVEAARCLFRYHWPLNIRELEQTLQTAAVLAGADEIAIEHLPDHVRTGIPVTVDTKPGQPALGPEDARRRDELLELLRRHQGNVSAIARDMGKDRKQIQRWLKRYRLKASAFRTG
jgi:DNA-binding NtrC family response regulator